MNQKKTFTEFSLKLLCKDSGSVFTLKSDRLEKMKDQTFNEPNSLNSKIFIVFLIESKFYSHTLGSEKR